MIHSEINTVVGLGKPGPKFERTRHNIGFLILDQVVAAEGGSWDQRDNMEIFQSQIGEQSILFIKPQTFMNDSGKVVPFLKKKGINPENVLIVHDDIDVPFGQIKLKQGGSARGHNGLKSFIEAWGPDFYRLRVGVGRPDEKDQISDYVLKPFSEPY